MFWELPHVQNCITGANKPRWATNHKPRWRWLFSKGGADPKTILDCLRSAKVNAAYKKQDFTELDAVNTPPEDMVTTFGLVLIMCDATIGNSKKDEAECARARAGLYAFLDGWLDKRHTVLSITGGTNPLREPPEMQLPVNNGMVTIDAVRGILGYTDKALKEVKKAEACRHPECPDGWFHLSALLVACVARGAFLEGRDFLFNVVVGLSRAIMMHVEIAVFLRGRLA